MDDIIHKPTRSEFKRMAAQLGYEQVVHGRWIPVENGAWAECSECGEGYDISDNGGMPAFKLFCDCYKYCPNCGAKMQEVERYDQTRCCCVAGAVVR